MTKIKIKIIIAILVTIVLITGLSVFLFVKNRKTYITKTDEIKDIKISMLKFENGKSTIIKQVPTTGDWIMTYDCDDETVKIYWDEGNRKLLMKNIKPTECTIKFEESLSAVNVVSMYVDDVYIPKLDSTKTYSLERYECTNAETVTWNIITNEISIKPIEEGTSCKVYFKEEGYNKLKEVNSPVLVAGMTPVKWNASNVESTTTADDPEWYDYSSKKWANAKTEDGSYWVWIPRYAYKITSGYHTSTAGTIDIKFLVNKTNITKYGTKIETSGYNADTKNTSMHYFTHPAFTFGSDELTGIWVAKYEASVANISDLCYTTESDANCNKTSLIPAFKPNVKSWRYINNSNMFDVSYNLKTKSNYGWNGTTIDTHMMKNTEWAAIGYLAQSTYGANAKIWINNSGTFVTGCAANSASEEQYAGCQNAYNTASGVKASTTHNITGIYDMSGGIYERTAAYINNGDSALTTNGQSIINAAAKYKNIYTKATTDSIQNNYLENKNKYGDAIYETSSSYSGNTSWYNEYSNMPYINSPWIVVGGDYTVSVSAGLFVFYYSAGASSNFGGFRAVAVVP